MNHPVEIFFSYAHEDEELRKELVKHLRLLERQGIISTWYDRDIHAGAEWQKEIDKHLNTTDIILLLVSADFLNSDYCYSSEMIRAIERHERGEARVIPVILRPVYWQNAPFGKLQALPKNILPVTEWRSRDAALFDIAEGIREAAEELHLSRSQRGISSKPVPLCAYRGHTSSILDIACSPDGSRIASAGGDHTVHIWNARNGGYLLDYQGHTDRIWSVAWSPGGHRIASAGDDRSVHIWNADTGKHIFTYRGHSGEILEVAWSPDGKYIASLGTLGDNTVQVWNAATGEQLCIYREHDSNLSSVAWSPDGHHIASVDSDYQAKLKVWSATTGTTNMTYDTDHSTLSRTAIAWSPNGEYIAASGPGKISIYSAVIGKRISIYHCYDDADIGRDYDDDTWIEDIAWSPNGRYLAAAVSSPVYETDMVKILEAGSGVSLFTLESNEGVTPRAFSVIWSPDNSYVAYALTDLGNPKGSIISVWQISS